MPGDELWKVPWSSFPVVPSLVWVALSTHAHKKADICNNIKYEGYKKEPGKLKGERGQDSCSPLSTFPHSIHRNIQPNRHVGKINSSPPHPQFRPPRFSYPRSVTVQRSYRKMPQISFQLYATLSCSPKFQSPSPLPAWAVNHAFVQCLHAIRHLVAFLVGYCSAEV